MIKIASTETFTEILFLPWKQQSMNQSDFTDKGTKLL